MATGKRRHAYILFSVLDSRPFLPLTLFSKRQSQCNPTKTKTLHATDGQFVYKCIKGGCHVVNLGGVQSCLGEWGGEIITWGPDAVFGRWERVRGQVGAEVVSGRRPTSEAWQAVRACVLELLRRHVRGQRPLMWDLVHGLFAKKMSQGT